MQKEYVLGGAIVVGCGLIGLGLYAGLSSRGEVPRSPSASSVSAAASSAVAAAAPEPAAALAPADSASPSSSASAEGSARPLASSSSTPKQEVAKALAEQKKALFVPKCWEPALAREAEPKTSRYLFSLGFDGQGVERARGISEIRGESRADVARCLRDQPAGGLRITPTGATVSVEVTLDFP